MAHNDSTKQTTSHWMNVDLFTVEQASALWINADPAGIWSGTHFNPPEYAAIKQMLTAGIVTGELPADTSTNAFRIIGDHDKSLVSRADLEVYARKRKLFPAFLFDTLAPFQQQDAFASLARIERPKTLIQQESTSANRGGRPAQYDWDSFTMEIIHRANLPDGLPEKQGCSRAGNAFLVPDDIRSRTGGKRRESQNIEDLQVSGRGQKSVGLGFWPFLAARRCRT